VDPKAWERFLSQRNAALLGCDFVTTFKDTYIWEVGKDFVMADFENLSLYMAGVFTPKDPSYRNVILTGRTFLQEVDDRRGMANQIFIKLDNRSYADEAKTAAEALDFPIKIHVEPAQEALDQAIDDLNDMLRYASYVILFTSFIILICLANTISMSTYDRAQEIGILRSIGFERPRVLGLILVESAALGLIGGALGCLAAYLTLTMGNQSFSIRGYTIPLEMRPVLLSVGLGASLIVGIVGGFLPAIKASRAKIVESLRKAE
jgi:putative ABC transport system permease protein